MIRWTYGYNPHCGWNVYRDDQWCGLTFQTEVAAEAYCVRQAQVTLMECIEQESERQVIQRLGHTPEIWYTGGAQYNDYRLRCQLVNGGIQVTDGFRIEYLDAESLESSDADIRDYIRAWLDQSMPKEAHHDGRLQ